MCTHRTLLTPLLISHSCLHSGDYTGQPPCTTQEYEGSSITVYDPAQWQFAGNDEVVW